MFPSDFLPQLTERLILRRFTELDLETFVAYRQDPHVGRFQSWSVLSYDEARAFIQDMSVAPIGIPGEWFQLAIAHKPSNQLLGDIGIKPYAEEPQVLEIGFTLRRKEQGKGYAREALKALIQTLFELEHLNKIIGITDARNEASIRLLKHLGMQLVQSVEVEFRGELCIEQTFELNKKINTQS